MFIALNNRQLAVSDDDAVTRMLAVAAGQIGSRISRVDPRRASCSVDQANPAPFHGKFGLSV